jgi:hypothetical protein
VRPPQAHAQSTPPGLPEFCRRRRDS